MAEVKIVVTERPNTVRVEYRGEVHTARWRNEERLLDVKGDEGILRAAMVAWCGEKAWVLEDTELARRGGGWWAVPTA